MDNKISASGLSAMVALTTGMPGDLCEKFIKELCSLIADTLETGENVRIKGLGTFKIVEIESRKSVDVTTGEEIEIPSHSRVIFVPCKELASLVNAPFEAFEAEEVADDLPTDELMLDPEECDFESIYEEDDSETDELLQEDSDENTDYPNEVPDKDTDSTEAGSAAVGSDENADSTEADSVEVSSGENADSSKDTTGEDTEPKGNEGQGLRKCIVFGSEGMDDGNGEEGVNVSQRVISFGENEDALTSGPVILTAPSDSISITKDESGSEELEKPTEPQTEVAIDTQETYAYNSGDESNEQTDETDSISAYIEPNEEEEGLNYAQSGSVESPRRGRFYRGFLLGFLTAAVVVALLFLLGIRYGYIPTEKQNSRLAEGKEVTAEKQSMQSGSHPTVATDSATRDE
ncbi:MAG: HU family DNA-binding protein, partial [Muribaculaceae bacterium]|nr:HU family DNA-binding protein [Muribaculaceae bacterium]